MLMTDVKMMMNISARILRSTVLNGMRLTAIIRTVESRRKAYESGEKDVPLGDIPQLAALFDTDPFAIFTGINSHAGIFALTRKGKGPVVERNANYHYESLNASFTGAKILPYIVTLDAHPGNERINLNSHPGEEFDRVIEGRLEFLIGGHTIILDEGDSVYFDSTKMHGMRALDGKPAKFLAIITAS